MRRWMIFSVLAVLLSLVLALPALGAEKENSTLINAEDLVNLADSDSVVIVDTRDAEAYQAGHIPGAVSVESSEFYEDRDGVKKLAAGPEKFSALISNIGIDKDSQVIIYNTDKDLSYATRAWWVFHMYDFQNVQVLDGGIDSWQALGYELSTDAVTPSTTKCTVTKEDVQDNTIATIDEVKSALNNNAIIMDCRSTEYYQGKLTKAERNGHITGAVLIEPSELLNNDMTFKKAADLSRVFAEYGITENTPVIPYCNTGTNATIHYFALTQILGYNNVQLFDASMMGWSLDAAMPMTSNYDFFAVDSLNANVNSNNLSLPAAPFVVEGKSYIAADILAKSLEAEIDEPNNDFTTLTRGDDTFSANPLIKDNIVFLPTREVAEALGASIEWDGANKQITLFLP